MPFLLTHLFTVPHLMLNTTKNDESRSKNSMCFIHTFKIEKAYLFLTMKLKKPIKVLVSII